MPFFGIISSFFDNDTRFVQDISDIIGIYKLYNRYINYYVMFYLCSVTVKIFIIHAVGMDGGVKLIDVTIQYLIEIDKRNVIYIFI